MQLTVTQKHVQNSHSCACFRSLKPAKHAGLTLLRHKAAAQRQALCLPSADWPSGAPSASQQSCGAQPRQSPPPLEVTEGADGESESGMEQRTTGTASRLTSFPLPDSPDIDAPGAARYSEDSVAASANWAGQKSGSREWPRSGLDEGAATENGGSGGSRQSGGQRGAFGGAARGLTGGFTPGTLAIEDVEWHGRIEQDWYAATALVDLLSFIYVAVFYQVILSTVIVISPSFHCPKGPLLL